MSAALHTLNVLLEQAQAERDQAQRSLSDLLARARSMHAQATDLRNYRLEYEQRWGHQFASGGTMEIVQCYQNFSGRLEEAITSQGEKAANADQRVASARQHLAALEMRVASITKLIERRRQEIDRIVARQEQKYGDELSARIALARSPQGMLP